MSVAELHDLELVWPHPGPADVIVTGTFDQWSSSIHLVKGDAGFFGTVKVPWGQKVAYKFIVDGRWLCRDDRPQEDDGHGNYNNVLRTPNRPELPTVQELPTRFSIPPTCAQSEGYQRDAEAAEFLPATEPAISESFPLPVPQVVVQEPRYVPSACALDTTAVTEETVAPITLALPTETPFKRAPPPCGANGSTSLPLANANGEAYDSHSFSTHVLVQFTEGTETAREAAVPPLGSAVPDLTHPPHVVETLRTSCEVDVTPAPVPESPTKQPEACLPLETAAQDHSRQASACASATPSPPSTPTSRFSTLIHKKRRSLFARIRHVFDKDKDKDKDDRQQKRKH